MRETNNIAKWLVPVAILFAWIAIVLIAADAQIKKYLNPTAAEPKEPPVIRRSITPKTLRELEDRLRRTGQ